MQVQPDTILNAGAAGRSWLTLVVIVLVTCVLLAGCTRPAANSDQDRHAGFYGGVSGGVR
jgi:hypothetical protein